MAYTVIVTDPALDDLITIAFHISRDSPATASTLVRKIFDSIEKLEDFPLIGRIAPEFDDPVMREIFVSSYRVIYRFHGNVVEIWMIIHGRRDLMRLKDPRAPNRKRRK